MDQTVLRSHLYDLMDAGEAFDVEYITADKKRGTGGRWITLDGWQKVQAGRVNTAAPQPGGYSAKVFFPAKENTHQEHGTVNVYNPRNPEQIRKLHIDLIQTFNGKRVIND